MHFPAVVLHCTSSVMKAAVLASILAIVVATIWWFATDDPAYRLHEITSMGRYDSQDELILASGKRYGVPPELIKAVIWRESRFHPEKTGAHGERGLMQITEAAAQDWAKAEKIETFAPTDLYDPKVNIEAGSWYLGRALQHWKAKEDAVPFALAEYNAGRTRAPLGKGLGTRRSRRGGRFAGRDGFSRHEELRRGDCRSI